MAARCSHSPTSTTTDGEGRAPADVRIPVREQRWAGQDDRPPGPVQLVTDHRGDCDQGQSEQKGERVDRACPGAATVWFSFGAWTGAVPTRGSELPILHLLVRRGRDSPCRP